MTNVSAHPARTPGTAPVPRRYNFDFYETPEAFTRYLLRRWPAPIASRLFSPTCGNLAIPRVAETFGADDWVVNDYDPRWPADLHMDAREAALWREVEPEYTIDNPPFLPVMKILQLALEHSTKGVAFHLRASIHEPLRGMTKRGKPTAEFIRRSFFREHPPTGILWLPRFGYQRSKKSGKWSSDSVTACWCIWERGTRAQFIDYADEECFADLAAETPLYRARMDALMQQRGEGVKDALERRR